MTCTWCNGSGEREGSYGQLDCSAPNCTAATERAALEAANKAAEPMTVYDQRWFAYQAGKASAFEQAGKICDAERSEFMRQAGDNNGRESDFAFGSVNSSERIASAIRGLK